MRLALLLLLPLLPGGPALDRLRTIDAALAMVYQDRVLPLKQLKGVADPCAASMVDTAHELRSGALKREAGLKAVGEKAYAGIHREADEQQLAATAHRENNRIGARPWT